MHYRNSMNQDLETNYDSVKLHEVYKRYMKSQSQKALLKNRILIMQMNQESNQKRLGILQTQMDKMQKIKQNYIKDRKQAASIFRQQYENTQNQNALKIRTVKQSQIITAAVRKEMVEFKKGQTEKVKGWSRQNQAKLQAFRKSQIIQKQLNRIRIKREQQYASTKRFKFMQNKKQAARVENLSQLKDVQQRNNESMADVQELKRLQMEMLDRYTQSKFSLRDSRASCNNSISSKNQKRQLNVKKLKSVYLR